MVIEVISLLKYLYVFFNLFFFYTLPVNSEGSAYILLVSSQKQVATIPVLSVGQAASVPSSSAGVASLN